MHAFYDKVTDKARDSLERANAFARRKGHPLVTNFHILWGILEQGDNLGESILTNLGMDCTRMKLQVEEILGMGRYDSHGPAVPYDADASKCLCEAIEQGRKIKHIGCQHLLLALLDKGTPAGLFLDKAGVTIELCLAEMKAIVKPVLS